MKRGVKKVSRSTWLKAGGAFPEKPTGVNAMNAAELRYYNWIVPAMQQVGFGGNSDLMMVVLACRIAVRADLLRKSLDGLTDLLIPGQRGVQMHPVVQELSRTESRLKDALAALYLSPRTRGSSQLPVNLEAEVSGSQPEEQNPILKLLQG
jgi:hypothetical protein